MGREGTTIAADASAPLMFTYTIPIKDKAEGSVQQAAQICWAYEQSTCCFQAQREEKRKLAMQC